MALTSQERQMVWAKFMSDVSSRNETFGAFLKHDLRDAVDAVDQWIDDNQASFVAAIPQPCRSELTARQKVELFFSVARRRWEVI